MQCTCDRTLNPPLRHGKGDGAPVNTLPGPPFLKLSRSLVPIFSSFGNEAQLLGVPCPAALVCLKDLLGPTALFAALSGDGCELGVSVGLIASRKTLQ